MDIMKLSEKIISSAYEFANAVNRINRLKPNDLLNIFIIFNLQYIKSIFFESFVVE